MSGPYSDLPSHAYWRRSVAAPAMGDVDPVVSAQFTLTPQDRIATAGSCFAQHIARHLRNAGFNFLVTETAHPLLTESQADSYNYGLYSARYGNIYTARQLVQLFDRAYGRYVPIDDVWVEEDGLVDPFRPQIGPRRIDNMREYHSDREQHFKCVRECFEKLDLFVFTLGLTECWLSREDGAAYPLCPGVVAGRFDPKRHVFRNFSTAEVTADMIAFADRLRSVNATARMLVTVSPVPLIATAAPRHVLTSTTYSKAVLRVAAEELCAARAFVNYFPSYEIITGNHARGTYFAEDLRSVTEAGVAHVMKLFMRHYTDSRATSPHPAAQRTRDTFTEEITQLVKVRCDEEALDVAR